VAEVAERLVIAGVTTVAVIGLIVAGA